MALLKPDWSACKQPNYFIVYNPPPPPKQNISINKTIPVLLLYHSVEQSLCSVIIATNSLTNLLPTYFNN